MSYGYASLSYSHFNPSWPIFFSLFSYHNFLYTGLSHGWKRAIEKPRREQLGHKANHHSLTSKAERLAQARKTLGTGKAEHWSKRISSNGHQTTTIGQLLGTNWEVGVLLLSALYFLNSSFITMTTTAIFKAAFLCTLVIRVHKVRTADKNYHLWHPPPLIS